MNTYVNIPHWDELNEIFDDKNYTHLTRAHINKLNKLGYRCVYGGKHDKLYCPDGYLITLSRSPSYANTGRNVLRQIRRHYNKIK